MSPGTHWALAGFIESGIEIVARPDQDIFDDATSPTSLQAQGGMQGQNYTHGGNPEVDALYEEFLREPDTDAPAVSSQSNAGTISDQMASRRSVVGPR